MKKYFVSSDIHSFYDEWIRELTNMGFELHNPDHHIIVCGDIFDRGNQSVEVYEFVKTLIDLNRFIYIRGNHEDLLFECCAQLGKRDVGYHHISNGTVKTISHFLGISDYDVLCTCYRVSDYENKVEPVLQFIRDHALDYYELGNFVFVHGWIPLSRKSEHDCTQVVSDNWRDGRWGDARWLNGMECAHFGLTIPGKTVVCGHWHTSWGHSRYHNEGGEWDPNTCNMYPYVDEGIIALDACTAYSHMVNVITIEQDKSGNWIATIPEAEELK